MNSRRSFFKTVSAVVGATVLPVTVLAQGVGDKKYIQLNMQQPTTDSASLNKMREILNNNSFKPGWGFDLSVPQKQGSVSLLIYTPNGTHKWGRKVLIPHELVEDDTFDVVGFIKDHTASLDRQFADPQVRSSQGLLPL